MKIDELRLTNEELAQVSRNCDYSMVPARIEVDEPDEFIETANAQLHKIQRLANLKGKIIAFVPEGIAVNSEDIIEVEYER